MEEKLDELINLIKDYNIKINEINDRLDTIEYRLIDVQKSSNDAIKKWGIFYGLSLGADYLLGIKHPPSNFL